ncbi:DUF2007 domain-containing protein [Aliiroseovarius crassostreae]|uniref:DUF2007 domain-containing protein n=1 Tax=Aliiroseovarius crassostreae TaxID=154981 RepID=UPI00220E6C79|nr:DUF2007 domain-containing protein [Aliiroseovarius crassostreae]UWQ09835.1 DUF2007 domain-containing protein [Aliiroseovarius crassostreae]
MLGNRQFEHIGWAYGAADISLVAATFEGAGIPCFIHGATPHQVLSNMAVAMGGARVMVFPEHAEGARELLCQCAYSASEGRRSKGVWGALVLSVALMLGGLASGIMPMHCRFIAVRGGVPDVSGQRVTSPPA